MQARHITQWALVISYGHTQIVMRLEGTMDGRFSNWEYAYHYLSKQYLTPSYSDGTTQWTIWFAAKVFFKNKAKHPTAKLRSISPVEEKIN